MVLLVPTIRVSVCISPLVSVAHDSDVCPLACPRMRITFARSLVEVYRHGEIGCPRCWHELIGAGKLTGIVSGRRRFSASNVHQRPTLRQVGSRELEDELGPAAA